MSFPKETPGKIIVPHIAKKDLLEVNIVVVYIECYLSKVSFLSKTCLIEPMVYQNSVDYTRTVVYSGVLSDCEELVGYPVDADRVESGLKELDGIGMILNLVYIEK